MMSPTTSTLSFGAAAGPVGPLGEVGSDVAVVEPLGAAPLEAARSGLVWWACVGSRLLRAGSGQHQRRRCCGPEAAGVCRLGVLPAFPDGIRGCPHPA
jgi:hypothetical protein